VSGRGQEAMKLLNNAYRNNGGLIYWVLMAAVVGIWTKVILSFNNENMLGRDVHVSEINHANKVMSQIIPEDLKLEYRDPFFNDMSEKKKIIKNIYKKQILPSRDVLKSEVIKWPKLQYNGMIVNKSKNLTLALLTIGKEQRIYAQGQMIGDFKIEIITSDSLVFFSRDRRMTYYKNS